MPESPPAPRASPSTEALGASFDRRREDYYVPRYDLRRQLCLVLFGIAVVLGLAYGLAG